MWRTAARRCRAILTPLTSFLRANGTAEKEPSAALHPSKTLAVAATNSHSIFENLVTEEALMRALVLGKDQCLLLFYVNDPCVVVGRNQNIFQEVSLRRATADGVAVARRASGGGAVFHDSGNLCLSFLTHRARYAPERTVQILRLALCACYGIASSRLTTTARHDLFLDSMKITGSAMRVQHDIAYHHCTLLVDTPRTALGRYLHPEGDYVQFTSSSVGSVRSPVATLVSSGVVPPQVGAVANVQANLSSFFLTMGDRLLRAAPAPWSLDVRELAEMFCRDRHKCAASPFYTLDVVAAVQADDAFVAGEGRRLSRGDAETLGEAVERAQSKGWRYAMPTFTTTVSLSTSQLKSRLVSHSGWGTLVQLSSLTAEELLAELRYFLFGDTGGEKKEKCEDQCGGSGAMAELHFRTTVERRTVSSVAVTVRYSHLTAAEKTVADASQEWLERYMAALLVGRPCDAAVEGLEAPGDVTPLIRGIAHEAGTRCPDLPGLAQEAALLIVAQVLISVWREKNVFDITT